MLMEAGSQQGLCHAGTGNQFVVSQHRQVRSPTAQGDGLLLERINFWVVLRGEHPTDVPKGLFHKVRPVIVGVSNVGRYVEAVTEERQVELLDGDGRATNPLHADVGKVDK